MLCSTVPDVLEQKLVWFESLENTFRFTCFRFHFYVLYIYCTCWRLFIYDEQKCKVIYCRNTTWKTPDKIYFQLPNPKTERKQAEIWLNNISTGYNKYLQDDVFCSHHFHGNCIQIDMQAKLFWHKPKGRTVKPETKKSSIHFGNWPSEKNFITCPHSQLCIRIYIFCLKKKQTLKTVIWKHKSAKETMSSWFISFDFDLSLLPFY